MTSVQNWLTDFAHHASNGDGAGVAALFLGDGYWRDYLPFGFTLQTLEGSEQIADFARTHGAKSGFRNPQFDGARDDQDGFFTFKTRLGTGTGHIRLVDGKCQTLLTTLDDLQFAPPHSERVDGRDERSPDVLIVGGGQAGLALGAQLSKLGVSYLIVDNYDRVGGQWRSRYDSLVLHDPVWYDHMPHRPFPEGWPVFTPKNDMGDWLESYANALDLNIWTSTECIGAEFVEAEWQVELRRNGEPIPVTATHLVLAVGVSGFPHTPRFPDRDKFQGPQMHSSAFEGGVGYEGQRVVVVGANNSAHDIATDLVAHGAHPVMIQRSSTLVVRQSVYCEDLLGSLYSKEALEQGITTRKADLLSASIPMRMLEEIHRGLWIRIREREAEFYDQLQAAGFTIDFAEDGAGLGLKYRRTASGYYIDVGGSQLVIDGKIGIRSGVTVDYLVKDGLVLSTGEHLPADAIVYATGYGMMEDWVGALIDPETASKIGRCWGYGSGTRGDPGPWVGELRNMWMPTEQQGLWFMGGNLAQCRFFSHYLALQLQGRLLGLDSGP
ncbi:MAG: NAD(P)/FAD-dependent oxidoreductase [Pseudomonadota bacterium]